MLPTVLPQLLIRDVHSTQFSLCDIQGCSGSLSSPRSVEMNNHSYRILCSCDLIQARIPRFLEKVFSDIVSFSVLFVILVVQNSVLSRRGNVLHSTILALLLNLLAETNLHLRERLLFNGRWFGMLSFRQAGIVADLMKCFSLAKHREGIPRWSDRFGW